jgi:hypothetical protein
MAIDMKIRDNHFHLDGINFFRGNANTVRLGSVGGKRTPSTQENYLGVEENIPVGKLTINKITVLTLNGTRISGGDVNAEIDVPGIGTLSPHVVSTRLQEDTLKLVKVDVLPRIAVEAANQSPKVLDALVRAGNRGRIAHQVVVVMDAASAETIRRGVSFDFTTDGGSPAITVHGVAGSKEVNTVRINSGATFAYLLLEPKWDANRQKNWTRIEDWKDDQWSLY